MIAQWEAIHSFLIWQRPKIITGEWWRIVTGNWTHTNWAHLGMNLTTLGAILWLFQDSLSDKRLISLIFIFSLFIGCLLYITPLQGYAGLSGVLYALFFWGCIQEIKQRITSAYWLFFAGALKIADEQIMGASEHITHLINAPVAIEAHLFGSIIGILFSAAMPNMKENRQ